MLPTAQRLAKTASDTEKQAAKEYEDIPVELRCRFCPDESPRKIKWNSQVAYEWHFSGFGYDATATQYLRCDNVLQQSVPTVNAVMARHQQDPHLTTANTKTFKF